MLKLIALRPLNGCSSSALKCLKINTIYYFCNDYNITDRAMRTHYKPQMNGERYYTTEEVCQVLKITKRTLQQYRDDGVIPFVALPGKMLYRESDLRTALEKNYVAPFVHRNAEDFPAVYGRR